MKRPTLHSLLLLSLLAAALSAPLSATGGRPPCTPCAGWTVDDPGRVAELLHRAPALAGDARFYVRWERDATKLAADAGSVAALDATGATPWLSVAFHTPPPLLENITALEAELAAATEFARANPSLRHFDVRWLPIDGSRAESQEEDYAFLFKQASVALQGATPGARILPRPLPRDAEAIDAFYALGSGAYLDGIVLAPGSPPLEPLATALAALDPGRPLVAVGLETPNPPAGALAVAARQAAAGISIALFDQPQPTAEALAPLIVLANEFQGDLSYDAASSPTGSGVEAWSFVRGEDLQARVVVRSETTEPAQLWFADPTLRNPESFDLTTGTRSSLFGLTRETGRLGVRLDDSAPISVLSLERPSVEELEGLAEQVDVSGDKVVPVEEILRRLQAFEDAQNRRLKHYQAIHTNHLRFQAGGEGALEVAYEGPYFYRRDVGFDWAWRDLFINGVRWKRDRLPEIPILQPEKAAAAPLEIHFTPEFRYRLRGTEPVGERDCWVIDFEPGEDSAATERKLQRGTVWVDREHFGRVRMRTVQLGLTGDVLSNEETVNFRPVDAQGAEQPWTPDAFWLPLHTEGQQIFTILNESLVVEREGHFRELRINAEDFETARRQVLDSEVTMVRDTEQGLRYLTKNRESGEREVQEEFDTSKLFLVGGVFYDDAADFPLPLAGVDYLDLDFRDSGRQLNVFFAGVLLQASISEPSLFGSRFDAGVGAFALGIGLTDETFVDGEEAPSQDVEFRPASIEFEGGRAIGSHFRLGFEYQITRLDYSRADDTADDFTLPSDHLIHSVELLGRYSRNGYRLTLAGSYNQRDEWDAWGTPDQVASFDPETDQFYRYRVQLAKNWFLPKFQKIGAEVAWVGGENLDRFTRYEFGSFSDTRIHGYQSSSVRAEEAALGHLSYGLNVGDVFRLEGLLDMALASNDATGLDQEFLAGVGLSGGFLGPWGTLMRVDAGVAVAGPDDGFGIELLFLKLFR